MLEIEHSANPLHIAHVWRNERSTRLTARVGNQDVEDEASRDTLEFQPVALNQCGERLAQRLPRSSGRSDQAPSTEIRPKDELVQPVAILPSADAGGELRGDNGTEE